MLFLMVAALAALTVGAIAIAVVWELKNKAVKWRLAMLALMIFMLVVDGLFFTWFQVAEVSFDQAFRAEADLQTAVCGMADSDRRLLQGVSDYLSSGKDVAPLAAKIRRLKEDSVAFYQPSLIWPQYQYREHIVAFNRLGNELSTLAGAKSNP